LANAVKCSETHILEDNGVLNILDARIVIALFTQITNGPYMYTA